MMWRIQGGMELEEQGSRRRKSSVRLWIMVE